MFRGATIGSFALFSAIAVAWAGFTLVVRDKDRNLFAEKLHRKVMATTQGSPYLPSSQLRENVRKDIWFAQDETERLHHRIESKRSHLTLKPVKSHFEVVETLENLRCWMQDKLYDEDELPMQQTRFLEASEGLYSYSIQQFSAVGVNLSLFRIPGSTLPSEVLDEKRAFLRGIARNVSFTFSGKTPQFKAEEFKATLVKDK